MRARGGLRGDLTRLIGAIGLGLALAVGSLLLPGGMGAWAAAPSGAPTPAARPPGAAVAASSGGAQDCYNAIDPNYWRTAVRSLIHIATPADVETRRAQLIQFIWKDRGFPSGAMPDKVVRSVRSPVDGLANLASVDVIDIALPYGFNSVVYYFKPVQSTHHLVIWHAGHADTLQANGGQTAIQYFLSRGYSVLGFFMPLEGPNTTTLASITRKGADGHDQMGSLESPSFTPIELFLDPIAITLHYVRARDSFVDTTMIGISGGGWTTTLYAAVDPSIRYSYPVAGSLPLYLRTDVCGAADLADWEQNGSALYRSFDYTELYVLGSYGAGRRQVQILNQYDSCCFAGVRYRTYEGVVRSLVARLGQGRFDVYLDESGLHDHLVSEHMLDSAVALPTEFDAYVLDGQTGRGLADVAVRVHDTRPDGSGGSHIAISDANGEIRVYTFMYDSLSLAVAGRPPAGISQFVPATVGSVAYPYAFTAGAGCGEADNPCLIRGIPASA